MKSIEQLFPIPWRRDVYWDQTPYSPPGATPESNVKLVELMRLNDERYHTFFNNLGYHNHMTHHLLAAWSLGASPTILNEIYEEHASYLLPKPNPPEIITDENWKEHLGRDNEIYYESYRAFFAHKISQLGVSNTLEKYLFANDANHALPGTMMLARFYSGAIHPMIHSGHVEFGMPGMLAQGLGQTAVTNITTGMLFPDDFFNVENDVGSQLASLSFSQQDSKSQGLHSFTIVAKMLADDRLAPSKIRRLNSTEPFAETMENVGKIIREYAKQWIVPNDGKPATLRGKIEELQWLSTIIYGVGGWKDGYKFRSDFFLMHVLTSSIFIATLAAHLSPVSQSALLRGHFSLLLSFWVSRGRPELPIASFFEAVTPIPTPPGPKPAPSNEALGKETDVQSHDNPWLSIIQSVIHHPDEHLVKTVRALQHYSQIYGQRPQGTFKDTELEGADKLDGTLFVRVAGNAMSALGWVREGEHLGKHDHAGLGWKEAWD